MKPICVDCKMFFRPERTGTSVLEQMPVPSNAKPGTAEPENWKPYKLWMGDLFRCPSFGAQIVVGFGSKPLAEHFQPNFKAEMEYAGSDFVTVNDC